MTATGLADVMPADRITAPEEDAGLLARLVSAGHGRPEAVLRPTSTSEVVEAMRWATANGVGVLPLASGARLRPRPAASDARRWVVLRTDRLAGVEIYEAADLTLTAGAGTPMRDVDGALRANGQWAPFDPPQVLQRSLGGLVADAARGPLWTGYGELRNHVLGMTVVTGDGRLLRLGGRVVKNVAGFDLLKPMTGSRGALAVMTSVTVRAFPVPVEDLLLTIRGGSVQDLLPHALRAGTAPILPVSIVLADVGAPRLLVRLHGARATVEADRATLEAHLGRELEPVEGEEASALITAVRDQAAGAPVVIEASVRPSRLAALLDAATALDSTDPSVSTNGQRSGGTVVDTYAGFARLGLADVGVDALRSFAREVDDLGGAVRIVRTPSLELAATDAGPPKEEAVLVDRLRTAFDPAGVLWPAR